MTINGTSGHPFSKVLSALSVFLLLITSAGCSFYDNVQVKAGLDLANFGGPFVGVDIKLGTNLKLRGINDENAMRHLGTIQLERLRDNQSRFGEMEGANGQHISDDERGDR